MTSRGRTALRITRLVTASAAEVEVISRHAPTDRGRVGVEQHLEVAAEGALELRTVDVGDVGRGDGGLRDRDRRDDAGIGDQDRSLRRVVVRELRRRLVVGQEVGEGAVSYTH